MKTLIYMAVAVVIMFATLTWLLKGLEDDMDRIDKAAAVEPVDLEPDKMSFTEYDGKMQLMLGYTTAIRQAIAKYHNKHDRYPENLPTLVTEKLIPNVPANPMGPGNGSVAVVRDGSADWCYTPETGVVQPGDTADHYVTQRKSLAALPAMEFNQRLAKRDEILQRAREALMAYIAERGMAPADLQALVDANLIDELPRNTLAFGDGSTNSRPDGSADWHYDPAAGHLGYGSREQAMLRPRMPKLPIGVSPTDLQMQRQIMEAAQQRAGQMSAMAATQQIRAALDVYLAENGQLPAALQELVPDYLPTIPINPSGTGEWRYNPQTGEVQPK